jgi:hypothetical protein
MLTLMSAGHNSYVLKSLTFVTATVDAPMSKLECHKKGVASCSSWQASFPYELGHAGTKVTYKVSTVTVRFYVFYVAVSIFLGTLLTSQYIILPAPL